MTTTTELRTGTGFDGVVYLTGVSTPLTRAAHRPDLGLLVTPDSAVHGQAGHYPFYAADNGLYAATKPRKDGTVKGWDADKWMSWVAKLDPTGLLFVTLPDVLHWFRDPETGKDFPIGDAPATIARGAEYIDFVESLGFPVALVAQDGMTSLDDVPYADRLAAVFIGGSDAYKLGPDAAALAADAKARGLFVHMGRVNSLKRMRIAAAMGADSADGTFLMRAPTINFDRMTGWLDTLAADRELVLAA